MYKIIYIDEYKDDIDDFLDYFEEKDTNNKFKIQYLLPEKTLDEMYDKIFEGNPDAVVSDYMLNEYKNDISFNVPYSGVDLTERITGTKANFPCFVLTSYDDQAIKSSQDVNIIYIKDILHGSEDKTNAKANFLDMVENQIIHYRTRIENAEKELLELTEKADNKTLNANDEARLLKLDTFIVNSTNQLSVLPEHLKGTKNLEKLHKMIDNTDKLLEKLRELKNG